MLDSLKLKPFRFDFETNHVQTDLHFGQNFAFY